MRRCLYSAVGLFVFVALSAPQAARGDTITPMFFDNFEAETPDILNSGLLKWNVTAGSIDVLSQGNFCGAAGNFSTCVDLDGTGARAGVMQTKQVFTLDPGLYRLSFDLAGANRKWPGSESNTVTVSLGAYFSEDFTLLRYDPFQTFTRDITVPGLDAASIVFNHHGADWIGLLLDNVGLQRVVVDVPDIPDIPDVPDEVIPTPEPGTLGLLATALALAAWRFRKDLS